MNNYAIILAGGSGCRLQSKTPKCFIKIEGNEIYKYSLTTFTLFKDFKKIVLVVPKQHVKNVKPFNKKVKVVAGGKTRNESFEKGIKALGKIDLNSKILVHDAARIFALPIDVKNLLKSKQNFGTLVVQNSHAKKQKHRDKIIKFNGKEYSVQTPQFCTYKIYVQSKKNDGGDDLLSYLNLKPKKANLITSKSGLLNFKITYKEDVQIAKEFLQIIRKDYQ